MEQDPETGIILDIDGPVSALAKALRMAEADVYRAMADLARRFASAARSD